MFSGGLHAARKETRSLSLTPVSRIEIRTDKRSFMVDGKRDIVYLESLRQEILLVESLDFEQCVYGSFPAY